MKYLIVNDMWTVKGGTERRLIDYEKKLISEGHNVYVQTSERFDDCDYSDIDIAEFHNIVLFGFDIFKLFLKKFPNKLIFYPHDYFPVCHRRILGRKFLGKFKKCRKPGFFRCLFCIKFSDFLKNRKRVKVFKKAESMILVSKFMIRKFKYMGFVKSKFKCDFPKINNVYKKLPKIKRDSKLIAFSGRDTEYKGFAVLKKALNILDQREIEYRFEHTGDSNWLTLEEMVEFYNRVRVIVVPSIWEEPFGLVSLEAKKCGALVVASDIGGLPETKPDYVFEPENHEELASILERILKD